MVHNYCQLASHDSIVLKEIDNNKQRLVVHVHNTLFVAFDSNNIIRYVLQLEKTCIVRGEFLDNKTESFLYM